MKLRSGQVYNSMNSQAEDFNKVIHALNVCYKDAEILMTKPENVEALHSVIAEVNQHYDTLMLMCTHLPDESLIPGGQTSKEDFKKGRAEFSERVKEWFATLERKKEEPLYSFSGSYHPHRYPDSGSVKTSSTVRDIRRREAQVKLELAWLAKQQNEARRLEQEQLLHLKRLSDVAEENRLIQAAEIEAQIWEAETECDRTAHVRCPPLPFPRAARLQPKNDIQQEMILPRHETQQEITGLQLPRPEIQ